MLLRPLSGFVRVLPCAELAAGEGLESQIRCVRIARQMVLVGRLQSGEVVAFAATCPHETTDLQGATFVAGNVRCPRHNYLYDPFSGQNVVPTQVSRPENLWRLRPGYLPTYRAEEHDGWVWIRETPNPAPEQWDPATEVPPAAPPTGPAATMSPPEPSAPADPVVHPTEWLRATVGGEFEVLLPTEPKPACSWQIEVPPATLTVVGQSYDPAAAPPHHQVRLRAHGAGEGILRCSYRRPWDTDPIEVRTYVVQVEA